MYEPLQCRNLNINGRRTSMRLEPMMWRLLEDIANRERLHLNALVSRIERKVQTLGIAKPNLASTVRLFAMEYFRAAATEEGHRRAGHGEGDPFAGIEARLPETGERRRGRKPAGDASFASSPAA